MYRGELENRVAVAFQRIPEGQRTRLIKSLQGKSYEAITAFSAILHQQGIDSRFSDMEFASLVSHLTRLYVPIPKTSLEVTDTGVVFKNLSCFSSTGEIFESYAELRVDTDVVRNEDRSIMFFMPYQAAAHCEQEGKFNPSAALQFAYLAACFQEKDNLPEAKKILNQYKDKGNGNGWHSANTLVNWGNQSIIHYPHDEDFTSHAGNQGINRERTRREFQFSRDHFADLPLKKALRREVMKPFIQDLTGLQDPSLLIEIGKYFGKEARIWVSALNEVRAAWLGCGNINFYLYASSNLYVNNAARGVRATAGSAHAP